MALPSLYFRQKIYHLMILDFLISFYFFHPKKSKKAVGLVAIFFKTNFFYRFFFFLNLKKNCDLTLAQEKPKSKKQKIMPGSGHTLFTF